MDSKYKVWSDEGRPRSEDVYQVMAAGRVNRCREVCLVYPSPRGERLTPRVSELDGDGYPRRVAAVFIDVARMDDPGGEDVLVRQMQEDLIRLLRS